MKSKPSWQVRRTGITQRDGRRRWDEAYQLLLHWAVETEEVACLSLYPLWRRKPMEVALYVRVSTNRQQQQQTIEQQLARLRAHIAVQSDWHLADDHIYRDDGYSGAQLNRPGLDRLRDRAALGAFERLLLTAPDR